MEALFIREDMYIINNDEDFAELIEEKLGYEARIYVEERADYTKQLEEETTDLQQVVEDFENNKQLIELEEEKQELFKLNLDLRDKNNELENKLLLLEDELKRKTTDVQVEDDEDRIPF